MQRDDKRQDAGKKFIEKAKQIRKDHPRLGCRKLASKLSGRGMGRDKIETLLLSSGFRVVYPPNYTRTTHSLRGSAYPNLIKGLKVNGINKVVQTDITYLWANNRFYYLVFIIDVYSRRIVGYYASDNMRADANLEALKMMIKLRGKANIKGLIHHSDKGSQYHATAYLKLLADHGIIVSMCSEAWENAYTERLNRTMKEEYLKFCDIRDLDGLKKELDRTVKLYNQSRPHWSLPKQSSPAEFEKALKKLDSEGRPEMTLYDDANKHIRKITPAQHHKKEAATCSVN